MQIGILSTRMHEEDSLSPSDIGEREVNADGFTFPPPKGLIGSSGNSKASTTINFWEEWSRRRGHQQLQDSEQEEDL